jgi:hypothetical protein
LGTSQITPCTNVRRLGYILAVAACVMAAPTPGSAQTAAEKAACKSDVFRLCAEEIPNVRRILACMRARKARLSSPCRLVFDSYER